MAFIMPTTCFGVSVNKRKNPIYESIIILNTSIEREVAYSYSNIIAKYSRRYRLNPFLVVSIAKQESGITLSAERGYFTGKVYALSDNTLVRNYEISDFCMMQIHRSNVIKLKLDPNRLLEDPEYCIHEGIKILKHFKFFQTLEPYIWWSRYNASSIDKRELYRQDVLRHYLKLKGSIKAFKKIVERYTQQEYIQFSNTPIQD